MGWEILCDHLEKYSWPQVLAASKVGAAVNVNLGRGWCLRSIELDQIKISILKKSSLKDLFLKVRLP